MGRGACLGGVGKGEQFRNRDTRCRDCERRGVAVPPTLIHPLIPRRASAINMVTADLGNQCPENFKGARFMVPSVGSGRATYVLGGGGRAVTAAVRAGGPALLVAPPMGTTELEQNLTLLDPGAASSSTQRQPLTQPTPGTPTSHSRQSGAPRLHSSEPCNSPKRQRKPRDG